MTSTFVDLDVLPAAFDSSHVYLPEEEKMMIRLIDFSIVLIENYRMHYYSGRVNLPASASPAAAKLTQVSPSATAASMSDRMRVHFTDGAGSPSNCNNSFVVSIHQQ